MADYTQRTEVTTRVVFELPNPTNPTEFAKACTAARRMLAERYRDYDDTITVEADEEHIRLVVKGEHMSDEEKRNLQGTVARSWAGEL